jgi:hypothetical protein
MSTHEIDPDGVTSADAAGALLVLRIVVWWVLSPTRWAEVSLLVTAAMAAVSRGDRRSRAGVSATNSKHRSRCLSCAWVR